MKYSALKKMLSVIALLLCISCSDETETISDLRGGDEVSQTVLDKGSYTLSKEGGMTEFKFTNVSVDSCYIQSEHPDWLMLDKIGSYSDELDLYLTAQPNNDWDTRTAKLCLMKNVGTLPSVRVPFQRWKVARKSSSWRLTIRFSRLP